VYHRGLYDVLVTRLHIKKTQRHLRCSNVCFVPYSNNFDVTMVASPEHRSPTSLPLLKNGIVCVLIESPGAETRTEYFKYALSKIQPSESPAVFQSLLFHCDFRLEETAFRISNPTTTNDANLKTTKIYNVEFANHSFENKNWTS
jgi:hypothetical protein